MTVRRNNVTGGRGYDSNGVGCGEAEVAAMKTEVLMNFFFKEVEVKVKVCVGINLCGHESGGRGGLVIVTLEAETSEAKRMTGIIMHGVKEVD